MTNLFASIIDLSGNTPATNSITNELNDLYFVAPVSVFRNPINDQFTIQLIGNKNTIPFTITDAFEKTILSW